jgi:hypothetical protein
LPRLSEATAGGAPCEWVCFFLLSKIAALREATALANADEGLRDA